MKKATIARITLRPIGVIRSPLAGPDDAPKQGCEAAVRGELVLAREHRAAMLGLEPGMRVVLVYWLHRAERDRHQVHPRGDPSRPLRGVFATRSPHRPNPIALGTVTILAVRGCTIEVEGLDAVDGTPLLDVKCEMRAPGRGRSPLAEARRRR